MTVIILMLVLAAICGFAFHTLFGGSILSIPFYLAASLGGVVAGFALARLLNLNYLSIGGLPLITTVGGALLFLALVRRIQLV